MTNPQTFLMFDSTHETPMEVEASRGWTKEEKKHLLLFFSQKRHLSNFLYLVDINIGEDP